MFYKIVENGYIVRLGQPNVPLNGIVISEYDYNRLIEISLTCPEDTLESVYRLSNDTEQYVACSRTHVETVEWYVCKVKQGEITIDSVPTEYRAEVEAMLPTYKYTLDEVAQKLAEEAGLNGYDV